MRRSNGVGLRCFPSHTPIGLAKATGHSAALNLGARLAQGCEESSRVQ